MTVLKSDYAISFRTLTIWAGIAYSSFMRWRRRLVRGEPAIRRPGPQKVLPVDLDALETDLTSLKHGRKRSRHTGILHCIYRHGLSRREINCLIKTARGLANRALKEQRCRLEWHRPDLVWALDGCEIKAGCSQGKIYVQNLQDLHSTYKFEPLMTGREPSGDAVAEYLASCFRRYGEPLFLKRDNARNYNNRAVNALLGEKIVIPLNSPLYYPRYNGSIEHAQGEIKAYLLEKGADQSLPLQSAIHFLNHKPRRRLKGKIACESYFTRKKLRMGKRRRKEVFDWIKELAVAISEKMGLNGIDPAAWRVACQEWMEINGLLTVWKTDKVLPNLSSKMCHN